MVRGQLQRLQALDLADRLLRRLVGESGGEGAAVLGFGGDHVEADCAVFGDDRLVGLHHEVGDGVGEPVVAAGVAGVGVEPLLDDGPSSLGRLPAGRQGPEEGVVVDLIAVLEGGGVHLGGHAGGVDQGARLEGKALGRPLDLGGGLAGGGTLSAGDEEARIALQAGQGLLQGAADDGGEAGGVPVEAQEAAEGLEPVGIREAGQHLPWAKLFDDDERNIT